MTTFLVALAAAALASLATWRLCKARGVLNAILAEAGKEDPESQRIAGADAARAKEIALAAQYAGAIEALTPEPCKHRDGRDLERCPKCAARRAVRAAADVVRETGGVQ